ncbi:MAG: heme-binding domain-containing protein [Bacteroidia bacterium]|jgi:hypothetical protein|nr:heme-binding domain-containing protein [Bacteroidia bacterium]
MKYITKKSILLTVASIFVLLQLVRPQMNNGEIKSSLHISNIVYVSDTIESVLQKSCYDCHSNQTNYPWYTQVQPIGFWLNHHVDEGKSELNFSMFGAYKKKKQLHKLDECIEMIEEDEMPLESYTFIHQKAKLTAAEKLLLVRWAKESKNHLIGLKTE